VNEGHEAFSKSINMLERRLFYYKTIKEGRLKMNSDKILDCKGLFCPMPVVGVNKAIKEIEMGRY